MFDQICLEVGGVLLAFAGDRFSSAVAVADNNNGGGEGAAGVVAERIRRAVIRLGPNFVKIGQALASRPDLVGEAIAGELLLLQDAMPPFSNEVAREFIRQVTCRHDGRTVLLCVACLCGDGWRQVAPARPENVFFFFSLLNGDNAVLLLV